MGLRFFSNLEEAIAEVLICARQMRAASDQTVMDEIDATEAWRQLPKKLEHKREFYEKCGVHHLRLIRPEVYRAHLAKEKPNCRVGTAALPRPKYRPRRWRKRRL